MQQEDLKSASSIILRIFINILFNNLIAQIQFKVINSDICDWWIENYLRSDWFYEVDHLETLELIT